MVLQRLTGVETGLLGGVAMSLLLLANDAVIRRTMPKVLEIGTVLLFGALALYGGATEPLVDRRGPARGRCRPVAYRAGLDGDRPPFTLQYARESVPQALWRQPAFVRTNVIITAVWAAAFAVMSIIDLVWLLIPALPPRIVIVVTVLALLGAVKFTGWYPDRGRAGSANPTNA